MNYQKNRSIDMRTREAAIIRFLREQESPGATVRQVWEALQDPELLGDNITLQAYHRIMIKMEARGNLEVNPAEDAGPRKYRPSGYLTPENPLSLTDIEEALWRLSAPEALARYLDAVDYFESRKQDVLEKAAKGLMEEEPVDLVLSMFIDKLARLKESLDDYADPQTRDSIIEQEINSRHSELIMLVHRCYGLSTSVFDLGNVDQVKGGTHSIQPDWDLIRDALKMRVFGDKAIFFKPFVQNCPQGLDEGFPIAGSDGSTHAGVIRAGLGAEFVEDNGTLVLTFNNSIVRVQLPERTARDFDFPYHGVHDKGGIG